jgi:acetylornithine deacetylase
MDPVPAEALAGAYGGSRPSPPDPHAPPGFGFDGRGVPGGIEEAAPDELGREIAEAVAAQAQGIEDLLCSLIEQPTTLGNEAGGQAVMREALRELGIEPMEVAMDAAALRSHPAAAPFDWDPDGKVNLVGAWGGEGDGRSLILNGHVDVVPVESDDQWSRPPFRASREGDWVYGRGAADMKCGLAAIVGAVRGLRALGLEPAGRVLVESVVEEECGGNGTLATVLAGHTADAAVVAEPFGAAITTSQVGVLWFQVRIRGMAVHAAEERRGVNAIEKSFEVMRALRGLEAELNVAPPPPYDRFAHPINLNVGAIRGGGWASTVPGECLTSYRIALYPGASIRDLQDRIEAVVAETAVEDPEIFAHPPEVRYSGFTSEGYEIGDDHPLVTALAGAYARTTGSPPALVATTGTTDAGILGRVGGTPAVCFGPYAEQSHAADERVWFPSVVETAQVMASFVREWCGVA